MRFCHHFFVCTNQRPADGKPSCGRRGGDAVLAGLQQAALEDPALRSRVAVTAAGCLGPCFDGPNVVVYPEGTWYAAVTPEDAPALMASHAGRKMPLDRLRYRWPDEDEHDDDP